MDKATSALDSQTEQVLNDAIRSLVGNKTILVIARRETSLRSCGPIIDMSASRQDQALASAVIIAKCKT